MAARSWEWATRLLGLRVRIAPEAWVPVSNECCVLSGRGLSSLFQRIATECGVSEYDREALIMRRPWPTMGSCAMGNAIRSWIQKRSEKAVGGKNREKTEKIKTRRNIYVKRREGKCIRKIIGRQHDSRPNLKKKEFREERRFKNLSFIYSVHICGFQKSNISQACFVCDNSTVLT
jgi:hypothetical protein